MRKLSSATILLLSILHFSNAAAISTAEICSLRAQMVAAIAIERDKGVSQKAVVDLLFKQFGKNGIKRSTIDEYAGAVYAYPDVSPKKLYQVGELSCLQEFAK